MEKANLQPGDEKNPGDMIDSIRDYKTKVGNATNVPIADFKNLDKYRTISDHFFGNNIYFNLRNGKVFANIDANLQHQVLTSAISTIDFLNSVTSL